MAKPRKLAIKVCPQCGEERQIAASEFKRKGHTMCRRCAVKTSTFNLRSNGRFTAR